ncbi:hypothetical protein BN2537_2959 [Streptomyces venezuelae]|nr:hypothetical protein BN2537_2959 [Streptomyces venezuelae]
MNPAEVSWAPDRDAPDEQHAARTAGRLWGETCAKDEDAGRVRYELSSLRHVSDVFRLPTP